MSLQKQLRETGELLFRWRSYLPLVFIIIIIPAFQNFKYLFDSHAGNMIWTFSCMAISLIGLLIRSYTVGHVPKSTSGRNTNRQVANTLNTTGMYSITRNPLYLGNFFMMLGVVLFSRNVWIDLIYILAFWLYYERIIMAEEAFLQKQFGNEYEDYLDQTPAFIPDFKLWKPNILSFSLRNVFKREYSGLYGIIVSFTVLEFCGDYFAGGALIIDVFWVTIFILGSLAYVSLRTLRKRTRLLHVEGR